MSRRSKIQPNRRWIFADDEPEVEEEKKEKLPRSWKTSAERNRRKRKRARKSLRPLWIAS